MPQLILLLVLLLNPWPYLFVKYPLVLILSVLQTFVCLRYFTQIKYQSKSIFILLVLSLLVLFLSGPNLSIFRASPSEIYTLNQNRSYYPPTVGRIFQSRLTLALDKVAHRFFTGVDFGQYFFSGHPREMQTVSEYPKISWLFLPFFIIGLVYLLHGFFTRLLWLSVFTLAIYTFSFPDSFLSPAIMLPLVTVITSLGLFVFLLFLKHKRLYV